MIRHVGGCDDDGLGGVGGVVMLLLWRRWGGGGDDVDWLVWCGVGWRGGGVGCGGGSGGGWPESGRSGAIDGREESEEYGG
ncbi:hypothetical protein Tco_0367534 [Tanacetum coccineum]